jgi:hypothetical protein
MRSNLRRYKLRRFKHAMVTNIPAQPLQRLAGETKQSWFFTLSMGWVRSWLCVYRCLVPASMSVFCPRTSEHEKEAEKTTFALQSWSWVWVWVWTWGQTGVGHDSQSTTVHALLLLLDGATSRRTAAHAPPLKAQRDLSTHSCAAQLHAPLNAQLRTCHLTRHNCPRATSQRAAAHVPPLTRTRNQTAERGNNRALTTPRFWS